MMELQVGITVRVLGVEDDRLMKLMAVEDVPDSADGPYRRRFERTASVRPLAGGAERGFPVEAVEAVCTHPRLDRRGDGTYCTGCEALIYASDAS
ncbi:hypothetical protein IHE61_01270 [Streptomyces sp. GKU 257-1]|nr:hypothetical protein [Streptomyces sp. GKU 257-1]